MFEVVTSSDRDTHVWQWLQLVGLRIDLSVVRIFIARLIGVCDFVRSGVVSCISGQRLLWLQRRRPYTADAKGEY